VAYEGPDNFLTADELADILGLTAGRVRQLVKLGMPRTGRGEYGLRACVRWLLEYWRDKAMGTGAGSSLEESKRRKMAAEAGLKETRLQQDRGDLVPKAELWAMLEVIAVPFKTSMRSAGTKLAGRCEGRTKAQIKSEIDAEHDAILEDLAATVLTLRKAKKAPDPRAR